MRAISAIIAAIRAAFANLVVSTKSSLQWINGRLEHVTELVWNTVSGAGSLVATAVEDIVMLPVRAFAAVTSAPQTPEAAATKVRTLTEAEQAAADAGSDARIQVQAVRRVASAMRRGVTPQADDLALIPLALVGYIKKLTMAEAATLATCASAKIRDLVLNGIAPKGIRGMDEVIRAAVVPIKSLKAAKNAEALIAEYTPCAIRR